MNKFIVILLLGVIFIAGCASVGNFPHTSVTQVNLERNNYNMVAPNAMGASSGFSLFGIITLTTPQHTIAMSRLYDNAGIKPGGSYALANVIEENTSSYFILFSIPTYRVRADVVKFIDTKEDELSGVKAELDNTRKALNDAKAQMDKVTQLNEKNEREEVRGKVEPKGDK